MLLLERRLLARRARDPLFLVQSRRGITAPASNAAAITIATAIRRMLALRAVLRAALCSAAPRRRCLAAERGGRLAEGEALRDVAEVELPHVQHALH